MSITKPPDTKPEPHRRHDVALWAGVSAFFGSFLAIGVLDLTNPDDWVRLIAALPVALFTAGGVYAKERLDDAKREREREEKLAAGRGKSIG
jgi:predicted benzoate:H+ symporter BenE